MIKLNHFFLKPRLPKLNFFLVKLFILVMLLGFINSIDLKSMRSRELRKNLLKWGYDKRDLDVILDKSELRSLAETFYREKQQYDDNTAYNAKGVQFSIICIVIAGIVFFSEPLVSGLLSLVSGLKSGVDGFTYQIKERFRMISMSVVNRFPLAASTLVLATLIEVILPIIQTSIMASWVIPTGSPFRRYLFPMPNFAITVNDLMGHKEQPRRSQENSSSIPDFGGMGLNIAPMVVIWVCNYLKNRLENFGCSKLISIVNAKHKRKEERDALRKFRSNLNSETDIVFMDTVDDYSSASGNDFPGMNQNSGENGDNFPKPKKTKSPFDISPFEQEQMRKSAYLKQLHSGGQDVSYSSNNNDDGDSWLNDSASEDNDIDMDSHD
mmetsp:Transcript_26804/g.25668  ORF Transcript_26804/g.25668 Transcript_26804/m.25668 type:complete len:382 (-) Transcript_26804:239-1384(-)